MKSLSVMDMMRTGTEWGKCVREALECMMRLGLEDSGDHQHLVVIHIVSSGWSSNKNRKSASKIATPID